MDYIIIKIINIFLSNFKTKIVSHLKIYKIIFLFKKCLIYDLMSNVIVYRKIMKKGKNIYIILISYNIVCH